jgi:hypothetical protein
MYRRRARSAMMEGNWSLVVRECLELQEAFAHIDDFLKSPS